MFVCIISIVYKVIVCTFSLLIDITMHIISCILFNFETLNCCVEVVKRLILIIINKFYLTYFKSILNYGFKNNKLLFYLFFINKNLYYMHIKIIIKTHTQHCFIKN